MRKTEAEEFGMFSCLVISKLVINSYNFTYPLVRFRYCMYLCITINVADDWKINTIMRRLIDFVNSIPYDGMPNMEVNGYRFHWNGFFWEYVESANV